MIRSVLDWYVFEYINNYTCISGMILMYKNYTFRNEVEAVRLKVIQT